MGELVFKISMAQAFKIHATILRLRKKNFSWLYSVCINSAFLYDVSGKITKLICWHVAVILIFWSWSFHPVIDSHRNPTTRLWYAFMHAWYIFRVYVASAQKKKSCPLFVFPLVIVCTPFDIDLRIFVLALKILNLVISTKPPGEFWSLKIFHQQLLKKLLQVKKAKYCISLQFLVAIAVTFDAHVHKCLVYWQ